MPGIILSGCSIERISSKLTEGTPAGDLPKALAKYRQALEDSLRAAIPSTQDALHIALRYHMGWNNERGDPTGGTQGKRLRPALVLLACEAAGGAAEAALPAAIAVELVHDFSLIHDDIQDRDRERHHRPTVWAFWGEPQALSAGSAMYCLGYRAVSGLAPHGVPPDRMLYASHQLTHSSLEMMEGQYLDLEFERRTEVTTQQYLDMISRKTGALMACALELGVVVASGEPALASTFAQAGRYLGGLFQIRDDILGIWGQAAATGKPSASDIRRKKKTFPVVHALQHTTGAAAGAMRRIYRKEALADHDVQQVLEALDATHARAETEALAEKFSQQALETFRAAHLPKPWMRDIEDIVAFLLLRDR